MTEEHKQHMRAAALRRIAAMEALAGRRETAYGFIWRRAANP